MSMLSAHLCHEKKYILKPPSEKCLEKYLSFFAFRCHKSSYSFAFVKTSRPLVLCDQTPNTLLFHMTPTPTSYSACCDWTKLMAHFFKRDLIGCKGRKFKWFLSVKTNQPPNDFMLQMFFWLISGTVIAVHWTYNTR